MRHLIKGDGFMRAWCTRPGCGVSMEGGNAGAWTKEQHEKFFTGDCPAVWDHKDENIGKASFEKRVKHLIAYAKKEIKAWEKLINYWEKRI